MPVTWVPITWVPVIAALVGALAFAQEPAPARGKMGPSMLVLPVPGAALSAETIEERTSKLPDGTTKTEVLATTTFRDAAGRIRTEQNQEGPNGESALVMTIVDRVEGFMAVLIPSEKFAGRYQFPKQDPSSGLGIAMLGGPLAAVPGEKSITSESLGKETIDEIEYQGERTTTTSDDQSSLVGIYELWQSKELGLFGLMKSSCPEEQITTKIRKVDRSAPDRELFKIPSDYFIRDLKEDDPKQ
jgi:hypothetical protein